MKSFAIFSGALMLVAMIATDQAIAIEATRPATAQAAINVSTEGARVSTVGYRNYPRAYRYNSYYGPRYGSPYRYDNYYNGPRYRTNYYSPRYRGGYYGPSYYRGPAGAVNVYPGGVNVGGLHIGW